LRGDITSVGEFIRMYLSRYDRWASPLYLIGESYGTTRAAGLAGYLVDQGIAFNGLVLVSCALDFQGFVFSPGNDLPFLTYLPSYAASAWYHKKLAPDLQQADLPAVLREVEQWTDREYASILARGDRLTEVERREAAAKLARYTSLGPSDIDANNLRIGMSYFCKELLKQDRRSIGRFDSRYQGIESSAASASPSFDPSLAAVRAPYTSTFNNYIRVELGYKTDVPYYILGEGVGRWDWQRDMGYPATTDDLRDAMTKNPHMKVLIASGYYDLATPYRAVEHTLAAQGFDPTLRKNITIERYDAGHMMYVHGPSLHKLKHDGVALIDGAKGK
jgi:carboxypeptidase C (cathepsin A)